MEWSYSLLSSSPPSTHLFFCGISITPEAVAQSVGIDQSRAAVSHPLKWEGLHHSPTTTHYLQPTTTNTNLPSKSTICIRSRAKEREK